MYKLFDWECLTKDCPESFSPIECLTQDNEEVKCIGCGHNMKRMMPAPMGYVDILAKRRG